MDNQLFPLAAQPLVLLAFPVLFPPFFPREVQRRLQGFFLGEGRPLERHRALL
jgi:hypothetical protein